MIYFDFFGEEMQKAVLLISIVCIAGASAFAPSTLQLRKADVLPNKLGSCRRIPQQQTKMSMVSVPVSLATLSEHFTTSQILVSLFCNQRQ